MDGRHEVPERLVRRYVLVQRQEARVPPGAIALEHVPLAGLGQDLAEVEWPWGWSRPHAAGRPACP